MIKMHDMVKYSVGSHHQVADILSIQGDFQIQRVLDRPDRGNSMNGRSDPANPLGKNPGIPWIAALQYDFNAAPHGSG